jgi:Holliday junction DNA helicase RuvA
MIGALQGVIAEKEPPRVLIDVDGVGYDVEVPMSTFLALPPTGEHVRLRIHHVLREDASLLFGFATDEERALFRALLKVSGVGPRMALAILSGVTTQVFQQAVQAEDVTTLTRIPGVGRKTAERLLVEMRDYFGSLQVSGSNTAMPRGPAGEAMHALLALGYKPAEATRMLDAVKKDAHTTEELIRAALRGALDQ